MYLSRPIHEVCVNRAYSRSGRCVVMEYETVADSSVLSLLQLEYTVMYWRTTMRTIKSLVLYSNTDKGEVGLFLVHC